MAWYDTGVKRVVLVALPLTTLALLLSACSLSSLVPSATLVSATPTPVPTAPPTAPAVNPAMANGFDNNAGNCADAANEAIGLIGDAAAGRFGSSFFNMDMSLALEPHGPNSGCADATHIGHYRQYAVYSAQLTVWPLDYVWPNAGPVIRQQWLVDVLNVLSKQYPRATINVQALYNGVQCGTATIGPGKNGAPQIDPSCV